MSLSSNKWRWKTGCGRDRVQKKLLLPQKRECPKHGFFEAETGERCPICGAVMRWVQ